jgi:hypothetical protein
VAGAQTENAPAASVSILQQEAPGGCGIPPGRAPSAAGDPGSNELDWTVPSGHFFSQAGGQPNAGFAVFDDSSASFWSEFQRLGGWSVLGYPASRRFSWHSSQAQATQRAILQWSPVTGQVEFANILDLLHEQGLDESLLALEQIPPPADVDELGLAYETIAARRLQWLEDRPAIKAKYCNAPGGADPIVLWGLPTSTAINVSQTGEVYVVRTQRAAFQEWVGGASWAAPGEVTVVLAGDLAKEFNLIPADAVLPEPAPLR